MLALGVASLTAFVAGLWTTLSEEGVAPAALAGASGIALVPLYGAVAAEHLLVPSDARHIEGWMLPVSFLQALLLLAVAAASGARMRWAAVAALALQLVAAVFLLFEGTDGLGVRVSAGTFGLWATAVACGAPIVPRRRPR